MVGNITSENEKGEGSFIWIIIDDQFGFGIESVDSIAICRCISYEEHTRIINYSIQSRKKG